MSSNQRGKPKEVTNPHRDLPLQARLAMVDLLGEFARQAKGVRPMVKGPVPDPFAVEFHPAEDTGIKGVPKLKSTKKVSPARALIDSLEMGGRSAQQVATELGVSLNYMRKLMDVPELKAPSYTMPFGAKTLYIYTPEDVEELRAYLIAQRSPKPRKR